MAQYDGSIRINTKITTKDASSQLMSLENRIAKTVDKVSSLRLKMDSLRDTKIPTQEYAALDKELEVLTTQYEKLAERQYKFLTTGGKEGSSAYKRMEYDLDSLDKKQDEVIAKMKTLETSGKSFILGSNTEEFANLGQQLKYAENDLSVLIKKHDELTAKQEKNSNVYEKLGNVAKTAFSKTGSEIKNTSSKVKKFGSFVKSAFSKFHKSADKSNKTLSTLGSRFKGLALSLLIFNQVSKAFNALMSGIKEGFGNLYKEVDGFQSKVNGLKASALTLKNAFAAAFRPLVEIAIPYIQKAMQYITALMDKVGQFLAAITGQKTYTKAVQQTAAAFKDTADATKEAEKAAEGYLSPLDEINKFSSNKDDKSSGASGAGVDGSAGTMFETAPISNKFKELANEVKNIFSTIFDVFQKAWKSKGESVIKSAKESFGSLVDSAKAVGVTFYEVFTNGTGQEWVESILELLRSSLDIIYSISSAFEKAWDGGSGLENVTSLFNMFTNINNLLASIGDSFSRVFSNGTGVKVWENILGIITGVYNTVGNLARKINEAWNSSGVGDSIWQGILNIFNSILGTIHNIVDSTAKWADKLDFTPLLTSIDTLLKSLEPLTENIGSGLEWFWNNVLLPIGTWTIEEAIPAFLNMLSAAIDVLNIVLDIFKPLGEWLWNEFLQPLGEWTGDLIVGALETITGLLDGFTSSLSENGNAANIGASIVETLSNAWQNFIDVLTPIGEFLSGVFTSIWNDMLEPALSFIGNKVLPILIDTFKNLWEKVLKPLGDFLKSVFKPIIEKVTDVLNILWENVLVPFAQFIGGTLAEAWESFCEILNKTVIPIINKVVEAAKFLWEKVLSPIVDFLWDTLKPAFSTVFEGIGDIINGVKDVFSGLISFIKNVFTGDWKGAWESVKSIFSGIWETLSSIIKTPLNAVLSVFESLVNKIIGAWNWIKKQINSLSFDVPDWIPGIGGEKFGFNLSMSKEWKIPRLATGAVIPANKEFLAVLGDQKHGTNIEAPLDTIKQAQRESILEVLSELGLTGNRGKNNPQTIIIKQYLDGKQVAESVVKEGKARQMATGSNMFMLGTT